MQIVLLSDFQRSSFHIVGQLYEATLRSMGLEVVHTGYPTNDHQRADLLANHPNAIFLHNTFGRNFQPLPGHRDIALVLHEWSRYPPAWLPYLDGFEQIWVTTHHLVNVLRDSGAKPPVHFAPPAIDLEERPTKTDWTAHAPFRFLYVGETHFRKGLHLLFPAWEQAFPNPGEATLTIKTGKDSDLTSPRPDIQIIREHWSRERLLAHYAEHDCFVSASLAEGWGLPIAEAILAGLPVAANLWGGHASMLSAETSFTIPHQEIDQPYASLPELYAPGQKCGFSTPEAIADTLLRAVGSPRTERAKLAAAAYNVLLEHYSQTTVTARLANLANA